MKIPLIERAASPNLAAIFSPNPTILKPLITVALKNQEKKYKVLALLDTGADACLFPKDIADVLGIDVTKGQVCHFTGLGSKRTTFWFHEIEILFGEFQIKTKAGFSLGGIGVTGILGQKGFFDRLSVSFDYKNKYVDIAKP